MKAIGLIGAMAEEIALLREHLNGERTSQAAGIEFHQGTLHGKEVVVCKSGVGKVNAAVCTQLLIERYGVECVIFTGVAGALDPSLDIGDIVIASESMQHDMDVTPLGFARGVIPFQEISVFPADPQLQALALEAGRSEAEGRAIIGRVLSGDQFVASRETVKNLHEELGGACTEMEGAAVAQVCHMFGTPHVIIRSMSDKADGSAHANFAEFTVLASNRSYRIVESMVRKL